jgi:hypothetical protein
MLLVPAVALGVDAPAKVKVVGDWRVEASVATPGGASSATLDVPPPKVVDVKAERYERLPVFNPQGAEWARGVPLRGVFAQECSSTDLLVPPSVQVRGAGDSPIVYERGRDYQFDPRWGSLGRVASGRIGPEDAVAVSYRHWQLRLDAIVLEANGQIVLREGKPHAAAPLPPDLKDGERRLANVWLPGEIKRLAPENLFVVTETAYPEPPKPPISVAEKLLPKTIKKLRAGEKVRVLAWGDSVTDGTYLPDYQHQRWQAQFAARLQAAFPKAKVELVTEAWGGRNTSSYLAEPPGSPHNYQEKVLAAKPDLIVSEFVNDAGMNPEQVEQQYSRLLADFQKIGAEWAILTPHYVRPDWMGLAREQQIDDDPRPYVVGLRQFAGKHEVALGDASLRYGRLWRQGLPYRTLMLNAINHPDARGMKLFADALMELFP